MPTILAFMLDATLLLTNFNGRGNYLVVLPEIVLYITQVQYPRLSLTKSLQELHPEVLGFDPNRTKDLNQMKSVSAFRHPVMSSGCK